MRRLSIVYIVLFLVIGCIANSNASEVMYPSSISHDNNDKYYIKFMHTSSSYGFCFFDNGGCRHWTPANAYNCRSGRYYVQDELIYITWDNGQKERIELHYRSDGKAYINYKGRTYYDGYNAM